METIIIENRDEEKSIVHPQYGKVRYFIIKGKPWFMRADYAKAIRLSSHLNPYDNDEIPLLRVFMRYLRRANPVASLTNDKGLKFYMTKGNKNRELRQAVGNWLLKELYGEEIAEPEPLFKDEPTPVTLNAAQRQEIVDDVAEKFKNRPIILTDEQINAIAFKVFALIEAWKPDEDKIVDRVLEKFLSKFAAK